MRCDQCGELKEGIALIHDSLGRRALCPECLRERAAADSKQPAEPMKPQPAK